jgi:hypothetical protein
MYSVNLIFLNAVGALLSEHVHDFIRTTTRKGNFPNMTHVVMLHFPFRESNCQFEVWGMRAKEKQIFTFRNFPFRFALHPLDER